MAGPAAAQNPEDELGNWLIFNSTIRWSERWSVFTEAQVRLWEVVSNLNEVFARASAQYNFTPDVMVGLGYLRSHSWRFEDDGHEKIENRIYEQFGLSQNWSRTRFEHRYRLEQRWFREFGATGYSNRARYRLQVTAPLNHASMQPGAFFVNFYDEIFVNFDDPRAFDQNRLYGAGGYQFTPGANLQLGLLWQARASADFFRLQIFYTHNFDLHARGHDG